MRKRRGNKYNARAVWIDGKRFASGHEGKRYAALRLLERAGAIQNLQCQVKFPMVVNNIKICTYIADFVYEEMGWVKVEDAKGAATKKLASFRIKAKLFEALYCMKIDVV